MRFVQAFRLLLVCNRLFLRLINTHEDILLILLKDILYLMITNLPSAEEMRAAEQFLQAHPLQG